MEGASGTTRQDLTRRLGENPALFDFFALVRRLECIASGDRPEGERIGVSERPSYDPVRFCQTPELYFAPSAVERFKPASDQHPARLFVNFMGLLGPNGPMPLHVSEYIHDREHNAADSTPARFLDIFNNRMISMFYRAWAVHQMAASKDFGGDDSYSRFVGSMFGMGMPSFRGRDSVPDDAKIYFAGHLSGPTRHPEGLESILSYFFGVPASIREFVGNWMNVPDEFRCRLGETAENCTIGRTAVLGARIWDCSHKFRVTLGPMSFTDYDRLLPVRSSARRLAHWVKNYVTDDFVWDATLVLAKGEVPLIELGRVGRLGWTTWLHCDSLDRDPGDLVYGPEVAKTQAREDPAAAGEIPRAAAQKDARKAPATAPPEAGPTGEEHGVFEPVAPREAAEDDEIHDVMGSDLPPDIEVEVRSFLDRIAALEGRQGA